VEININKLISRLKTQQIDIDISKSVKEILAERGYDQKFGARPLKRAIQKYLEDPLSEEILKGTIKEKTKIKVKTKKGSEEFIFSDVTKAEISNKDSSEEIIGDKKDNKE